VDVLPLLDRAYAETIAVAAKLTPDDLDRPTPCTEWTVRDLVNHFLLSATRLSEATVGEPGPAAGADLVGDDAPAAVASGLEAARALWHRPGALDAICSLTVGDLPGSVAATISLVDTYTHRWDLARAVGGDTELDPELAEACLSFTQGFVTDELRGQVGFDPAVEPPAGASPGQRLVAFLGRRP
jgi:uncharacterized protein (TIGR03086 family)